MMDEWREARNVERRLRERLQSPEITLGDIVEAGMYASPHLTASRRLRRIGEDHLSGLNARLDARYPSAVCVVQQFAALGVSLGIGREDDVDVVVIRRTIRFNWNEARPILAELYALAEETRKWIPAGEERLALLRRIVTTASEIHTAIARENHRYERNQSISDRPTQAFAGDLDVVRPAVAGLKASFLKDAQRAARVKYAGGMAVGILVVAALCGLMGWIFAVDHIRAVYGVGLLAGALGAGASVFQRMTQGTLELNYQAVGKMLTIFGGLRPAVGGISGMVTFCILASGLFGFIEYPSSAAEQVTLVAVLAFLSGFSERFFQDMLAGASQGLSDGSPA